MAGPHDVILGDLDAADAELIAAADAVARARHRCAAAREGVEALATPPPPAWTGRYPGDTRPGHLRWGCSIEGNGDPHARHEAHTGRPIGVRSTFWQWGQRLTQLATTCRTDLAAGRLPWVRLKPPPWAAVAAGQHDADMAGLLRALDALGGPVWLTVHHEPEGGAGRNEPDDPAGPDGYSRMLARILDVRDQVRPANVEIVPIFMAYTWAAASGRDVDAWLPRTVTDRLRLLGVDYYEGKESAATLVTPYWLRVREWAGARRLDVAIGEWGNRGTNSVAAAEMAEFYEHAIGSHADGRGARMVALSYFDSDLNSPNGGWTLTGEPLVEFRRRVVDPRSVLANAS